MFKFLSLNHLERINLFLSLWGLTSMLSFVSLFTILQKFATCVGFFVCKTCVEIALVLLIQGRHTVERLCHCTIFWQKSTILLTVITLLSENVRVNGAVQFKERPPNENVNVNTSNIRASPMLYERLLLSNVNRKFTFP